VTPSRANEDATGRRATAPRTAGAILDAAVALLDGGPRPTMAAIAAGAGVSRPTLYAHYATIEAVMEAVVERTAAEVLAAVDAARPEKGPPADALERLLAVALDRLGRWDGLARGATERLGADAERRAREPLAERVTALVARGRGQGAFRADVPAEWLVSMFPALVRGADEHARAHGLDRAEALELLTRMARDVFLLDPGGRKKRKGR
jgi:AcrR family transcriptional regulator